MFIRIYFRLRLRNTVQCTIYIYRERLFFTQKIMENEWLDQNKRFLALAAQFGFDTLDSGTPTTEVKQILILCLIKIIFLLLEFYSFFNRKNKTLANFLATSPSFRGKSVTWNSSSTLSKKNPSRSHLFIKLSSLLSVLAGATMRVRLRLDMQTILVNSWI